jgi:hypothetical protein
VAIGMNLYEVTKPNLRVGYFYFLTNKSPGELFFYSLKIFTIFRINLLEAMRSFLMIGIVLVLFSCDTLHDIEELDGLCTILLTNGTTVVSNGNIEISDRTQAITYRDENGKIWSLFKEDYISYTCN